MVDSFICRGSDMFPFWHNMEYTHYLGGRTKYIAQMLKGVLCLIQDEAELHKNYSYPATIGWTALKAEFFPFLEVLQQIWGLVSICQGCFKSNLHIWKLHNEITTNSTSNTKSWWLFMLMTREESKNKCKIVSSN